MMERNNVQVLVPIGEGSEEIETVCITDTLARFGANVVTASVEAAVQNDESSMKLVGNANIVKMSCGLQIVADVTIEQARHTDWDLIVCPGGMKGAMSLKSSKILKELLQRQHARKKLIAGVCAAPSIVLASAGIFIEGATCYPAKILQDVIYDCSTEEDVIVRDHIVTATGPGTTIKFSLTLGKLLFGQNKANEVAKEILAFDFDSGDGAPDLERGEKLNPSNERQDDNTKEKRKASNSLDHKESKDETLPDSKRQTDNVDSVNLVPPKIKEEEEKLPTSKKRMREINEKTSPRKRVSVTPEKKSHTRLSLNKDIFFNVIWPKLEEGGFIMMKGKRPSDKYIFPPGVTKENGRVRKDYFDSISQVLNFLQSKKEYNNIHELYLICLEVINSKPQKQKQARRIFSLKILREEVIAKYPSLKSTFPTLK